jgi:hypothetical protein
MPVGAFGSRGRDFSAGPVLAVGLGFRLVRDFGFDTGLFMIDARIGI